MPQFDEVFDRITAATGAKTQAQLAEILGIRQPSISDAKRRNSIPAEWLLKLFKEFGLNPDWLEAGVGPWRLKDSFGKYETSDGPEPEMSMRAPEVRAYDTCATVQVISATGETVGRLCIPVAMHVSGLSVLKVTSRNMEPEIRKGAFVGIDTTQKHVELGELYAWRDQEANTTLFRAIHDAERGGYVLFCSRDGDEGGFIPTEKRAELIIGRVVWVLQEL